MHLPHYYSTNGDPEYPSAGGIREMIVVNLFIAPVSVEFRLFLHSVRVIKSIHMLKSSDKR